MILKLRARMDSQDIEVKNMGDASTVFRSWIEKNDYGSSNLVRCAGDIIDNGKKVAHVSYNGRVWSANEKEIILDNGAGLRS